jgi:O-antigen ligase
VTLAARSALVLAVLACGLAGAVEALVLDRLGPAAGIALPVGAAVAVVVARRPIVGVQLALLAVPLEFFAVRLGGQAGLSPTEMLLLLAAGAALLRWALGEERPPVPPVLQALVVLCALIAAGYAVATDTLIVTKILVMWSAFVVLGILVAGAPARQIARLAACLAFAGGVAGLVAVAGGGDQTLVAGGVIATNRAQASFEQPNVLGFFLVLAIPAAVVLATRGRPAVRVLMALLAAGALAGLMLSLSRTSILGTAVGLGVLLLLPAFRRVAAVALVAVALFTLFNFEAIERSREVTVVAQRIATLGQAASVRADPRLEIYRATPSIIGESPLLGVGAGNYSFAAQRYALLDHEDLPFDHAHNVPLTIAAEVGLPGLLVFGWFVVLLAGLVRRALAARRHPIAGPLLLAVVAAIAGSVFTSLGDYPPRTNAIAATFIVLVGALVALLREAQATE